MPSARLQLSLAGYQVARQTRTYKSFWSPCAGTQTGRRTEGSGRLRALPHLYGRTHPNAQEGSPKQTGRAFDHGLESVVIHLPPITTSLDTVPDRSYREERT